MRSPRFPGSKLKLLAVAVLVLGGCSIWPLDKRALTANARIRALALKAIERLPAERRARLIPPLMASLSSPDDRISHRAAAALVAVGEPAVDPLIDMTNAKDPYLRTLSLSVLGNIGTPASKIGPVLVSGLEDPHPLVREVAAHSLGELGTQANGAIPALLQTLEDKDPVVRDAARNALKRIGVKDEDLPKAALTS